MRIATRHSWNHKKLTDQYALLDYDERFTHEQYERISRGLIPREMEDKWFIFMEDDVLYFHRSWTGVCVYQVELAEEAGVHVTLTVKVSRNRNQYRCTDDRYDAELLRFLIHGLLVGEEVEFPVPGNLPKNTPVAIYRHHIVGCGHPGDRSNGH